ncbi:MAG: sensor histidine kinase [Floccifex sp.]
MKTIQKKFIKTAMIAITTLLTIMLVLLNAIVLYSNIKDIQNTLLALSNQNEIKERTPRIFNREMTKDDLLSSIYFTVYLDNNYNLVSIDLNRISSISVQEASAFIEKTENKQFGRISHFVFKKQQNLNGIQIIFLDITHTQINLLKVIISSCIAGILGWICMFFFVVYLSKKAIVPIEENIQKQKEFISNASHEIKTPLSIILSNIDAMELYNGENKWSMAIRKQVKRLNGLMNQLLMVSKVEEETKWEVKSISISNLLMAVIEDFEASFEQKQLLLKKEIQDCCLNSNLQQMQMLFSILIDNAIKYANPASVIQIQLYSKSNQMTFIIQNECENKPNLDKIFDRFYRGDENRSQSVPGYGMGCSVAKTIVEHLNGEIHVSFENNRIQFIVSIPLS